MMESKKILYVFNVSWFFLSHRLPVARAAKALGFEVHIAANPSGQDAERIKAEGFTFHPISLDRRGSGFLGALKTAIQLFRIYRDLKPDLVEHATIKPVIYGGIAARIARVPCTVNWMTGLGYVFIGSGLKRSLLRKGVISAYRVAMGLKSKYVIFENPDDRASFVEKNIISSESSTVIRGAGVDVDHFLPEAEPLGVPLIILASRMLWDKGVREFVEAACYLKNENIEARFILVGDSDPGNPAAVPVSQLNAWHESGAIEWWGKRDNMASVFAQSHIVCLPSLREGLPKVLVEAAACARPIVTTDVPGCREVVRHGINGLLVSPRDSKALADMLRVLIDDPEMRKRLGANGREIAVTDFLEKKVVSETLDIYERLLF